MAMAVEVNTEPSQSEQLQIVWDDPTAREERAKLADHMRWPCSPSQHSESLAALADPAHHPPAPGAHGSMTDSELIDMGKRKWRWTERKIKLKFLSRNKRDNERMTGQKMKKKIRERERERDCSWVHWTEGFDGIPLFVLYVYFVHVSVPCITGSMTD